MSEAISVDDSVAASVAAIAALDAELEEAKLASYASVEARRRAIRSVRNALDYALRRHARLVGNHTAEEWAAKVERYEFRCVRCSLQMSPDNPPCKVMHLPVADGGTMVIDNLLPLCPSCRSGRGADATDWCAYRDKHPFSDERSLPPMTGPETERDLLLAAWKRVLDKRSSKTDKR